jgi:hypothetical protein
MSDHSLAEYRKGILAAVGLALVVLTGLTDALGSEVPNWIPIAISVLTAVSVYYVPNERPTPPPDPIDPVDQTPV